jgi:hypothetical protein
MIKFIGRATLKIGDSIYQNTNCDENEGEDVSAAQDPENLCNFLTQQLKCR